MGIALRLKGSLLFFLGLIISQISFFFAQWQEFHTGILSSFNFFFYFLFNKMKGELVLGEIAVLEAEIMFISFYFLIFIFGNGWSLKELVGIKVGNIISVLVFTMALKTIFTQNIGTVKKKLLNDRKKFARALKGTLMCLLINFLLFIWVLISPSGIIGSDRALSFALIIIFYNSQISTRQILAKLCSLPDLYQLYYFPIPIFLGVFNALFFRNLFLDSFLISFNLISSFLFLLHFVLSFTKEICEYTNINCFKVAHNGEYHSWKHYLQVYFTGSIKN